MTRIPWSPHWQEVTAPDEAERFEAFGRDIAAIAREVAKRTHAAPGRASHIKKHTGVVGTLTVDANLEAPLANGVFAEARAWPCYVRFSNGGVRRQLDGVLDVRGAAIKLVGVPGPKLLPGHVDDVTQDFLFVQTPATPTDSFEEFLALARAGIGGPLFLPVKLMRAIGVSAALRLLFRLAAVPQPRSIAGGTYFNAVPLKLGPAAMKLSLVPEERAGEREGATLRDDVIVRLRRGPLRWRVRAQLYTDDRRTPIESAATAWEGAWHDVGTLELAQQDIESARGQEIDALVDTLAFNPWHASEHHRPLGATQRARMAAYRDSARQRGAAPEPTTVLAP